MTRVQFLLSTSLLACGIGVTASAVEPAAPAATSTGGESATDSQTVKEIVVTAERRYSTAQKTAASITVRTGDDLLLQGRYQLKNILEDVPGISGGAALAVNTSQGSGTDNAATGLIIRGIPSNSGAGGSSTSTAAAAAIYVDDVYNGIGGSYDIDRVEVLRGPQGTLYGRSATAGVVAIHTADPKTDAFHVEGTAELGDYNLHHLTANVNVPIVKDKLAVKVAGNLFERDGYYTAQGGAVSTEEFKVKALWTPTENFSALLGYAQQFNKTHSGGVSISQVGSPTNFVFTPQQVGSGRNHFRQYWGDFNLDLGPVAITYIPAYRTWYQNALIFARGRFNANQTVLTPNDDFQTHELRIHSTDNDSKFKWQAGTTYYRNALDDVNNLFNLDTQNFNFKEKSHKTTEAEGVFAEGTYAFSPTTRLTVGGRYDHTEIRNTEDYTSVLGITKSLTGEEGHKKFNNFNYKVRVEQDLTPQNLLYASVSTGFSPGDVTVTTNAAFQPEVQTLQAETLTAYEIGSKNRFFDNHLQVDAAAFYYDYGAYQTAGIDLSDNPANPTHTTIALPVKSYGAELEVLARPWAHGTFTFDGSYTRSQYSSLGAFAKFFYSKTIPAVAPYKATLAYDHRVAIGSATLYLRADVRYESAHDSARLTQQQGALAADYVRIKSQALGDLNATLTFKSNLSISAYVRNIADNRHLPDDWFVAQVVPGMTPGSAPQVFVDRTALSDPRTVGVVLNIKY